MPTSVPRPRSKATAAPATPLQGSAETSARPPAEPATPEALLALAALLGEQAAEEWLASLPAFKPQETRFMSTPIRPATQPRAPLYSLRDAAERLGNSARTVRRAIAHGDLPAIRVGKLIRIEPAALEAYLRRRAM